MATTTQTAERPQLVDTNTAPRTIGDLLQAPATIKRFAQVVPKHLSPERMLRVMAMAIYKTPELAKCEAITLLGAMMACASLGLEPNTPLGHAYLIPFKKRRKLPTGKWVDVIEVNLIIGYRGYIELARRSGSLVAVHADVVYEGDEFSFEYGTDMHLRHVPRGDREGRKPLYAYAFAKLTDGQAFEVLPYERVLVIRNSSQGYQAAVSAKEKAESDPGDEWRMRSYDSSPWVAFEHEMAAKTMVRRLAKMLPLSIEFANAAALDAMSEDGRLDLSALANNDMALADPSSATLKAEEQAPAPQLAKPTEQPITMNGAAGPEKAAVQTVGKTAPQTQPTESGPDTAGKSQPAKSAASKSTDLF